MFTKSNHSTTIYIFCFKSSWSWILFIFAISLMLEVKKYVFNQLRTENALGERAASAPSPNRALSSSLLTHSECSGTTIYIVYIVVWISNNLKTAESKQRLRTG